MIKNILYLLFVFVIVSSCKTQQPTATITEKGYLVGQISKSDLEKNPFSEWFFKKYSQYNPDNEVIAKIKPLLKEIEIKGFIGTWCGDSKREIPRFYKILKLTNFNVKNFSLIGVDRKLQSIDNQEKGKNIERVPTFIFYKNGKEIGRFVEYSVISLEEDILSILEENGYKNPYAK
ncbi:MAG: thioredoxin family protein [Capnocytophaga sp.]|nr:thioredoxin family protein [Capnocytophaga sp.]